MKKSQIIRAWKDEEYYLSLSDEERAQIPAHPAAVIELDDEALSGAGAGARSPMIEISDDSYTQPTGAGCSICCA